MGKIVKYCAACEEGFAEKFGFCPKCGAHLSAFEMNPITDPVADEANISEPEIIQPEAAVSPVSEYETLPQIEPVPVAETLSFSAIEPPAGIEEAEEVFEVEPFETPIEETKTFSAAASSNENSYPNQYQSSFGDKVFVSENYPGHKNKIDDSFHVTIVEEKNVKQRNMLLLGALMLMCSLAVAGVIYSIFNKALDVGAIDTQELFAYVGEVEPMPMEEEVQPKKDKDSGGGGGGGKEEPTPASKGREATQVDNPLFPPSSKMPQLTNPDIKIQAATQGDKKADLTPEPYGLKNGIDGLSDGTGSGGGLGNGRGRGQGNGEGTGLGNGIGSGYGNGNGNGNGNGTGDGNSDKDTPTVKVKPVGPTVGVQILSKPRANYTDSARQNQVQGKVVLRVAFLANGQIGSISPVSGLPNGLTEQAIAAARGIRFEPAKRAGVPYAVTKTIEYTFTIY